MGYKFKSAVKDDPIEKMGAKIWRKWVSKQNHTDV